MNTISFSVTNAYKGWAKVDGILHFSNNTLTLEFETKDSMFGFFKSGIKEIKLTASELEDFNLVKKFFQRYLVIKVRSLHSIQNFPHSEKGQIKLQVDKEHLKSLESMVSTMRFAISEAKLERLDKEMEDDYPL